MKFIQDVCLRGLMAILQHALDDPTAIGMCCKLMDLVCKGVDDERDMLGWDPLDSFLDYVVAVLVFDTLQDLIFKLFDKIGLLVNKDKLKRL